MINCIGKIQKKRISKLRFNLIHIGVFRICFLLMSRTIQIQANNKNRTSTGKTILPTGKEVSYPNVSPFT